MDRAPRFRPTTMVDEWPFGRPQRIPGPAARDNLKDVLYEDTASKKNSNSVAAVSGDNDKPAFGRTRDPNRQSDPVEADEKHPWNRCGIRKVDVPAHHEHAAGKRMSRQQMNATTLQDWSGRQLTQNEVTTMQRQQQISRESSPDHGCSSSASSSSSSSIARRRFKAQNQGRVGDLLALTEEDAFSGKTAAQDVGPEVGVSRAPRQGKQHNSAQLLQLKMAALARATGRCASALWQSAVEGHILKRPFGSAPSLHPQQQQQLAKKMMMQEEDAESELGRSAASSVSQDAFGGDRLRRTIPFLELLVQLESALDCEISDMALADVLGLGNCVEQTPVRYQNFIRLFN